jgi:hypothetical protein
VITLIAPLDLRGELREPPLQRSLVAPKFRGEFANDGVGKLSPLAADSNNRRIFSKSVFGGLVNRFFRRWLLPLVWMQKSEPPRSAANRSAIETFTFWLKACHALFCEICLYIVNTSRHYAWDGEAKKTVSE